MAKAKLTLNIDENVIKLAKETSSEKGISLSKIVENFLLFFSNPRVHCFSCGEEFDVKNAEECPSCGWFKCPICKICRCDIPDELAVALYRMRKVYEELLAGRVG